MSDTIQHLFAKIQRNAATDADIDCFRELLKTLPEEEYAYWLDKWTAHMEEQEVERPVSMPRRIFVATAALAALFIGAFFLIPKFSNQEIAEEHFAQMDSIIAAPAGNRAVLKLASGEEFNLNQDGDFLKIDQSSVRLGERTLFDKLSAEESIAAIQYHVLTTPKGGTMKVELPDGSKVQMNANSTLRFRADFALHRELQMSGELFFDVQRDEKHPFIVHTPNQRVKVLGTSFNINTYDADGREETSVASGLVEVSAAKQVVYLAKNQQAVSNKAGLSVHDADMSLILDWLSNEFIFKNATAIEVLREFERWYAIEIEVVDPHLLAKTRLWGNVQRSLNAYKALAQLNYFDIQYEVISEGGKKKIKVFKK